jgi:hypothetical protein
VKTLQYVCPCHQQKVNCMYECTYVNSAVAVRCEAVALAAASFAQSRAEPVQSTDKLPCSSRHRCSSTFFDNTIPRQRFAHEQASHDDTAFSRPNSPSHPTWTRPVCAAEYHPRRRHMEPLEHRGLGGCVASQEGPPCRKAAVS